jgi:predicted histone-like DNA-binding protein
MSINFKVTPKFNPTKPEDPPRYYARVVTAGKRLTTDQFCEQIADISTVSTIDVKAVLNAFRHVIPIRMREGWRLNIVDLFDIYPSVSGSGSDTAEDFNVGEHVDRIKVNVTVKKQLHDAVRNAELEKATWLEPKEEEAEGEKKASAGK